MRCWIAMLGLSFVLLGAAAQSPEPVAEKPGFEVSTVKPARPDEQGQHWSFHSNAMEIGNYTLLMMIKAAYGMKTNAQVLQAPEWVGKTYFDFAAKLDD